MVDCPEEISKADSPRGVLDPESLEDEKLPVLGAAIWPWFKTNGTILG